MSCGDNDQCLNSKVQRDITNQEQSELEPLKNRVGSGDINQIKLYISVRKPDITVTVVYVIEFE